MAKTEFTKQEIINLLNKHAVDKKISFDSLGEIVFDSQFPEELFHNAKEQIIKARDDEKRFKELANILLQKAQSGSEKQKQIVALSLGKLNNSETIESLRQQVKVIEQEMIPLEAELLEIKARIDERQEK